MYVSHFSNFRVTFTFYISTMIAIGNSDVKCAATDGRCIFFFTLTYI